MKEKDVLNNNLITDMSVMEKRKATHTVYETFLQITSSYNENESLTVIIWINVFLKKIQN